MKIPTLTLPIMVVDVFIIIHILPSCHRQVLCHELVAAYLSANFVSWGWDFTYHFEEQKEKWVHRLCTFY